MFTVKLYMGTKPSNMTQHTLSTAHFAITRYLAPLNKSDDLQEVVELTLYPTNTIQDGVTYRIAIDLPTPHFDHAFIENSNGKTIENLRSKTMVGIFDEGEAGNITP